MQKCAHIFSFYDLGTKTALKHIVLPSFPHEFIVDAEGRYAYVGIFGIETPNGRDLLLLTNSGEQSISVFDAAQLEEIERIALPANPTALSFHPLRSAAYVSFQDDHVRELDLGSWRFVNAIATLREPDACHVVPGGN